MTYRQKEHRAFLGKTHKNLLHVLNSLQRNVMTPEAVLKGPVGSGEMSGSEAGSPSASLGLHWILAVRVPCTMMGLPHWLWGAH